MIRNILLQWFVPLARKPPFCNRAYRITNIVLDWRVYWAGVGCWSAWGTHDDAPQLSYAASQHKGLTVLGLHKSENVLHVLYKPWSRISLTTRCCIKTTVLREVYSNPSLQRTISVLVYNLNIRQYVSTAVINTMSSQALS